MKLKIDKTRVTEGDIVTVKWDAGRAKDVSGTTIVIDNGFRKAEIPVERSGEKKFRLNRSDGHTVISVSALADGKQVRAEQRVKVRTARKYDSYTTVGTNKFKELFSTTWQSFRNRFRYRRQRNSTGSSYAGGWKSIPAEKRHSWIMLGILVVVFVISIFHTEAAFYGLGVLTIYLIWTLL